MLGTTHNDTTSFSSWSTSRPRRIIAYVRDLLSNAAPAEKPEKMEDLNMWNLVGEGAGRVNAAVSSMAYEGIDPTIDRITYKYQGFYVRVTQKRNFLKVASGHNVYYYPLRVGRGSLYSNPFFNVERIIAAAGERDDIHKKTPKKTARAKAA